MVPLLLAGRLFAADSSFHVAGSGVTGLEVDALDYTPAFQGVTFSPVLLWRHGERVFVESELSFDYGAEGFVSALEYADLQVDLGGPVLFTGMFLSPVGSFTQRLHSPWINKLPDFPLPYRTGAMPMSHVGAGVQHVANLGFLHKAGATLFVDNGPAYADGDPVLTPQVGDENVDKGVGGRLAVFPMAELELGGSAYTGAMGANAGSRYTLLVGDFSYTRGGWFDLRGEYVRATWTGKAFDGAWGQVSWRLQQVPALSRLEPVVRGGYASGDTPQAAAEEEEEEAHAKAAVARPKSAAHGASVDLGDEPVWEVCYGLDYWLRPNTVVKLAYTHSVERYDPAVSLTFAFGL